MTCNPAHARIPILWSRWKPASEPGQIAWRPVEIEAGAGHGCSTYSTSPPPPLPSPHSLLHIAISLSTPPLLRRATSPAPKTPTLVVEEKGEI